MHKILNRINININISFPKQKVNYLIISILAILYLGKNFPNKNVKADYVENFFSKSFAVTILISKFGTIMN